MVDLGRGVVVVPVALDCLTHYHTMTTFDALEEKAF